jgi:ribosomal protein S27E
VSRVYEDTAPVDDRPVGDAADLAATVGVIRSDEDHRVIDVLYCPDCESPDTVPGSRAATHWRCEACGADFWLAPPAEDPGATPGERGGDD